jgi:type IV pilus assembly protein PilM
VDQGTSGLTIENSAVEFEVLGRGGQPPQLDVLLVIAPQQMVNGRVTVMENAGFEPVAVDVEAFALLRAIEAAGLSAPEGEALVVMNMGATYTDLNIVVDREIAVTRSIPIGGNALTASLASMLNVPVEQAEEQKRLVDISPEEHQDESSDYGFITASDPARQVTVPFVDELIRELRRSVIFFQSQAAESGTAINVEHLVLAGGGTQILGLRSYLQERLGMRVSVLDPLDGARGNEALSGRLDGRGAELAVAVGLALKEYH